VDINKPIDKQEVLSWLKEHDIKILNIAGNSEETAPGIGDFVFKYLMGVFSDVKNGLDNMTHAE
jgi:hypothetical protein